MKGDESHESKSNILESVINIVDQNHMTFSVGCTRGSAMSQLEKNRLALGLLKYLNKNRT
jgi:hypothetical protein